MPASKLIERVADLIEVHRPGAPPAAAGHLDDLALRLREPVRVAVVGRVKAGKSTMVNALLGQAVAPTDVSECTKVVTWFRYGHPQRIVVELKDGRRTELQLTAQGMLPADLGIPLAEISDIQTYLANELLRSMTLVDTPGIGSAHDEISMSTRELLAVSQGSAAAAAKADAVVFLLNQVMLEDELETLRLFHGSTPEGEAGSAANAVGVLSRADQLADGERDSWEVALELAGRYASQFRKEVATVVPVIGLLAETAETAALTERDAKQLGVLAGLAEADFERLLWSADRFLAADVPVSAEQRERLLTLLDLYGIQRAVAFLRQGAGVGAGPLRRHLSALSGVADVKRMLTAYMHEQDHVLKVRSALSQLHRLSFESPEGAEARWFRALRSDVESLRLDPVMHPVAEVEAWHDCCTGRATLPPAMAEEAQRLFTPGPVARRLGLNPPADSDPAGVAREGMARWRTYLVTGAGPAEAKVARVVLRSYQLAWEQLR